MPAVKVWGGYVGEKHQNLSAQPGQELRDSNHLARQPQQKRLLSAASPSESIAVTATSALALVVVM
jgi:hypothetical protein